MHVQAGWLSTYCVQSNIIITVPWASPRPAVISRGIAFLGMLYQSGRCRNRHGEVNSLKVTQLVWGEVGIRPSSELLLLHYPPLWHGGEPVGEVRIQVRYKILQQDCEP